MRVENQTKIRVWEDSSLCPETSAKNTVQEFHLSVQIRSHLDSMEYKFGSKNIQYFYTHAYFSW
jgi:hypothetical protein